MCELFAELLAKDLGPRDAVDECRSAIVERQVRMRKSLRDLENDLKKHERVCARVKRVTEGVDLLQLQREIADAELRRRIGNGKLAMKVYERMLFLIDQYKDTGDLRLPVSPSQWAEASMPDLGFFVRGGR